MIVYPAIDLRHGQAVQLVGGRVDEQKVAIPDPLKTAQRWLDCGFKALHVVDLDAALGHGNNRVAIGEILVAATVPVQVGGGVRNDDDVADLIEAGAARVMVGTRAIEDRGWLTRMARQYPAQIVVAADVRGDHVVTRGWTNQTTISAETFIRELDDLPLAGVLITDVGREGQMIGIDVAKFENLVRRTVHPLLAAGGIRDLDDLRALDAVGVGGAVLGMSLYVGAIDPVAAVAEFV